MTDNPLTGKVGLDVTDFKTGISEMNREIRVIESGFRASAAALGDWSKDASGLELRIKALTGEIGLQQAKVNALRAEYERVAAEKGENSKAAQDLQIKLNRETETLNKMENELGQTEQALETMGKESKDAGKGAEQLAKAEDKAAGSTGKLKLALDQMKSRLGGITSGFKSLAGTVLKSVALGIAGLATAALGAAAGIGALGLKTAAAADEIVESAEKLGISTTKYQEFQFIADQIGTDVETIGRAFAKTTKAIGEAAKAGTPMNKVFKDLGVAVKDANGNLRDSEDVFADLIDSLEDVEDETQRDILAQQIFGKSFQELVPLINLGGDGLKELAGHAHEVGAVMSEETVNALADFNDKIAEIKGTAKGLIGQLAGAFLPIVNKVADALQDWLADPAVKEGIDRIVKSISEFAETLGRVLDKLLAGDLKGALLELFPPETVDQILSFSQTVSGLAKTFGDFVTNTIIPFVQAHGKQILDIILALGVAFGALTIITTVVGWIGGLITAIGGAAAAFTAAGGGIAGIVAILGGPLTIAVVAISALIALLFLAWKNNWGGIRDIVADVWNNKLKPIFEKVREWMAVNIPIAIEALKNFWVTVLLPAIQNVWNWLSTVLIPFLRDVVYPWIKDRLTEAIQTLSDFWTKTLQPAIQAVWNWISTVLIPFFRDVVVPWLQENIPAAIQTLSDFWNTVLLPAITAIWAFINDNLVPLFSALWELLSVAGSLAITALQGLWENVLLPALDKVWKFIQDNVIPILEDLWAFINDKVAPILRDTLGPIIQALVDGALLSLKWAFDNIRSAIQWVIEKIEALIEKLRNLKLPDWLTPGSPTPFELGLRGIAAAMDELNKKVLPNLAAGLNLNTPALARATQSITYDQRRVFYVSPVTVQTGERSFEDQVRFLEMMGG